LTAVLLAVVTLCGVPAQAHTRTTKATTKAHTKTTKKPPRLHGDPARAVLAYEAMQKHYYVHGSGLYLGEPFSYLWPFSQALAATVSLDSIPGMKASYSHEVHVRLIGLHSYQDFSNAEEPLGAFTSTLPAFDSEVAPPAGPGGIKYYDDNEWVGIELARVYQLSHNASALKNAEEIMAFVMAGWQTVGPEGEPLVCPGGVPFSNSVENTQRNTVTDAPAAELAIQLFKITHHVQYLQFAEMAYEWVRQCLLSSSGLYADHISPRGVINQALWSYNQGTMIGAGVLLYQVTRNSGYLSQARQTAQVALPYYTPERLRSEVPFFPLVYFRNLLYLDSVTHEPPGPSIAQAYVNHAWQDLRFSDDLFVSRPSTSPELLTQAAIVQIYALLSEPASSYF